MALAPAEAANLESFGLLLLGSAINQDGRSSSLTAPNGPAQQLIIAAVLAAAAADRSSISGTHIAAPLQ